MAMSLDDGRFRHIIESLPAAIYTTDAAGRITFYNEAAVEMWGRRPELGEDQWCGSWKLYRHEADSGYDPRQRPFYQRAKSAGRKDTVTGTHSARHCAIFLWKWWRG